MKMKQWPVLFSLLLFISITGVSTTTTTTTTTASSVLNDDEDMDEETPSPSPGSFASCDDDYAVCFIVRSKTYMDMLKCEKEVQLCKETLYQNKIKKLKAKVEVLLRGRERTKKGSVVKKVSSNEV